MGASFPILSFDQANPGLAGVGAAQNIIGQQFMNALNNQRAQQLAMQNQYLPQSLQQQLQAEQLKNALSQVDLKYADPMAAAKLKEQQANTSLKQFNLQHPLLTMPGVAGQLGAYQYLRDGDAKASPNSAGSAGAPGFTGSPQVGGVGMNLPGWYNMGNGSPSSSPSSLSDILMNSLNTQMRAQSAKAQLDIKRAGGYEFSRLPIDFKNQVIAQAQGLGYAPEEAMNQLMSGKTIQDLAIARGFDPNNMPDPIYGLTSASRNQLQRRQTALAEINSLGNKISDAMAPYARRFSGYSPLQVSQALGGEKEDDQAKFLAARALQPELAAIRIRMANGNVGIEAIRELTSTSMGNINVMQSLVSPSVYRQASKYIDQWLNDAANAANKQNINPKGYQTQQDSNKQAANSNQVKMPNFDTKEQFQAWYGTLDQNQQMSVRQQLGGS